MKKAGAIVAEVLDLAREVVRAGVTTKDIEQFADEKINVLGGEPAFKGYRGYPASICTSVNDEVVHGIPSSRKLRDGDIVSIDLGVLYDGFYGDAAITLPIGRIDDKTAVLLKVTEEALVAGIEKAVEGNRISDISHAIQRHAEQSGFSVVRTFVGTV